MHHNFIEHDWLFKWALLAPTNANVKNIILTFMSYYLEMLKYMNP